MTLRRPSVLIAVVVLGLVISAIGFFVWQSSEPSKAATGLRYRSVMNQAKRLAAQGKVEQVEALCREAIQISAERPDAYLLAAECATARADYDQALKDLGNIDPQHREQWISATTLKADLLHYDLANFQQAEQAYQQILAIDPSSVFANRGYAKLLGLCGRRIEAIPFVLTLIEQDAAGDLLVLLSREEGAISDPELIDKAFNNYPESSLPWLAKANLAILSLEHDSAAKLLQTALSKQPSEYTVGRLGRQLLLANDQDQLSKWAESLGSTEDLGGDNWTENNWTGETWLVFGQMAERRKETTAAVRCYWEAFQLWPESLEVTSRMAACLQLLNRLEEAELFRNRAAKLTQLRNAQKAAIMSSSPPSRDEILELLKAYDASGRIAEAYAWGQAAVQNFPNDRSLQKELAEIRSRLPSNLAALTVADFHSVAQLDYSEFAVPKDIKAVRSITSKTEAGVIQFERQAGEVGFDFTYDNGCGPQSHRTFGFTGGGIGAIDVDSDAWPDIVCTQGVPWIERAQETKGQQSDELQDTLFRNRRGEKFEALKFGLALPTEADFGQGVAVGDINEDGFPDLYIANATTNRLWVNNGDGTFSAGKLSASELLSRNGDATVDSVAASSSWTTSCLIADLNGDSFADLYDVNYLSGEDVFTRICQQQDGQKIMCGPEAFEGAVDRVLLNDGQGNFTDATAQFLKPAANGKGLGIVAFAQQSGRLNLFVANDTVANHLFVPVESTEAENTRNSFGSPQVAMMQDEAFVRGVAVNADGKAEACMGIAVADFDDDQRLDIVVTNFLHETNTLYHSITDNLFQDHTRSLGLRDATLPVLTFGTQFLDANNDGAQELFFANGYTQDLPGNEIPYAMSSQLFQYTNGQFQQVAGDAVGAWGQQKFVARSVAKMDWNADGLPDLAVGLLHEPSFLLTNQSPETGETGLTLKLVATESARDAIGASASASIDGKQQTAQLTAGDGYQCCNQRTIRLSGRRQSRFPAITVRWPSGNEQTYQDLPATGHWVAVEGHPRLWAISPKSN